MPYTAVASAGVANVFVMRLNEVQQGVAVMDEDGNKLGISKKAGMLGVSLSAVSRAVWSIPCLVVSGQMLSKYPFFPLPSSSSLGACNCDESFEEESLFLANEAAARAS